jgi:ectoine hydroxylase-related dioxygenase (phytanoyl-CoA dioxygenase family)
MYESNSIPADASERFARDGFVVIPRLLSPWRVYWLSRRIERTLAKRAFEVCVDDLGSGRRRLWGQVTDDERRRSRFKFNDLHLLLPAVREAALDRALSPLLARLLGHRPVLCNSLYFAHGSSQPPHVDSLYMTPQTSSHLIATWFALEDVHPDAGPLEYVPGSNRIAPWHFSHGGEHYVDTEMGEWNAYMAAEVARLGLKPERFCARRGDVFVWHAQLLHGGAPIADPSRTRRSLVFHYYSAHDCERSGWAMQPLNAGAWLERKRQAVVLEADDLERPQKNFPERAYLAAHPDIASAVRRGDYRSGYDHFRAYGHHERRSV